VAFNAIERMIGDFGIANKLKLSRLAVQPHAEKVAVIGAGPLACPAPINWFGADTRSRFSKP